MDKKTLYDILNAESEKLSLTELENILNEELDKSPEEMDTDLVDLCLDALNVSDEEKVHKRKHKIRISRILIAAVIFILVIGISIPACAKFLNIDVPEGIVKVYDDYFKVDLLYDGYIDDIYGQLEEDGISNPILPDFLLSDGMKISDYSKDSASADDLISFNFRSDEFEGNVNIVGNEKYEFAEGKGDVVYQFENVQYYNVDGMRVLVFGNEDVSYIMYIDKERDEYNICLNCDFKTACTIAQTL